MEKDERIAAFEKLGEEFNAVLNGKPRTQAGKEFAAGMATFFRSNGWYTENNLRHRLGVLAAGLRTEALEKWLNMYELSGAFTGKKIGVVLAGNIPLAGFDDFLSVLVSGHRFNGKLSSDDRFLLPLAAKMLIEIEPRFAGRVEFEERFLHEPDAVIATGSSNSSRYFDYYFSKYPHIIRKNRTAVAVLEGNETAAELEALGEDVFRYFGLGCRSVTKLFVPEGYDFSAFFNAVFSRAEELTQNSRYMNNYEYHRTLYLLNKAELLDNNFLLLKEDIGLSSPPGVLFYQCYSSLQDVRDLLKADSELLQCVVGRKSVWPDALSFGNSQVTLPSDYSDGVDTMAFLLALNRDE